MGSFAFVAALSILLFCNADTSSRRLLSRHGGGRYKSNNNNNSKGKNQASNSYTVRDRASGVTQNQNRAYPSGDGRRGGAYGTGSRVASRSNQSNQSNKNRNGYGSNANYKSGGHNDNNDNNNNKRYGRDSDIYDSHDQHGSPHSGYTGADRNNHDNSDYNNNENQSGYDHDNDNTFSNNNNFDNTFSGVHAPWGEYTDVELAARMAIEDDYQEQRDADRDGLLKDSYESYIYRDDFGDERHDASADDDQLDNLNGWNPSYNDDFQYGNPHGSPEHGFYGGSTVGDYSRDGVGYRGIQTPYNGDNQAAEPLKDGGSGSGSVPDARAVVQDDDDYEQERDRDDGHYGGLFRDSYESEDRDARHREQPLPNEHGEGLRGETDESAVDGNPYGSSERGYTGEANIGTEFRSGSEQPTEGIQQGRV